MPEHVDALLDFIEFSRRCGSFLSGWICSLISCHCRELVGSRWSSISTKLAAERDTHKPSLTSAMDYIDISSSDSDLDLEIDDVRETDVSPPTNSRILPSWASDYNSRSRSQGSNGNLRTSPPRAFPSVERTMNTNNCTSNTNDNVRARSFHSVPEVYANDSNDDGSLDSDDEDLFGKDVDSFSPQRDLKRKLPTSLQPSASTSRSDNSVQKTGGSHVRSSHGQSYGYQSGGPSLSNSKDYMKEGLTSRMNDGEVIVYENGDRSRILPPTLMGTKSASTMHYSSLGDNIYRPGIGEERSALTDERLIYQAALQDLNQPKMEANLPNGLLSVSLLRHQKIALAWMLQKETSSLACVGGILADDQGLGKTISMIALIQMQRFLQRQAKKSDDPSCNYRTEALNLDEDDDKNGSGLCKAKSMPESDELEMIPEPEVSATSSEAFHRRRLAAGTLVVCPASVLRQWARELDEKVADESKLSVLVYHGGNRTRDPAELAKYDVVVTTYSIVTNEVPKQPLVDEEDSDQKNGEKHGLSLEFSTMNKKPKKMSMPSANKRGKKKGKKDNDSSSYDFDCGPLARVSWFRVILDEAQTIKNHRTQVARACCGLRAKRRWCLSGTPIQNAVDDLYSYFRFLRYDPYADYKTFCNTIKIPISRNSVHGYKKLQAVLRAIMLRRTKGTYIDGRPIITLPPKSVRLTKVDFTSEERAFYSKLEAESRSQFKEYAEAGTVNQNYANILLMLLRLRQACDHPLLVKEYSSNSVGGVSLERVKRLPKVMLVSLLNLLESMAICRVCSDPPEDAVVTTCGHVFCNQCVSEYLTGDENMCPAPDCKKQLGPDVVFSETTLRCCLSDKDDLKFSNPSHSAQRSSLFQNGYGSSKIRAVLEILKSNLRLELGSVGCNGNAFMYKESHFEAEGPVKTIVFSQWTGMLDLVETSLNESCIQYRRLDGTMSLAARDRAVKDFNTDPEVMVMLMSLKAGNLGLNMVAACHVILLDLWWNPTTEDQAVDRAHRIGQTRPVTVSRLTIKDTVEDRILALQEEKRKMVASAFGEDQTGGSATRLTVEDLKYLFMF